MEAQIADPQELEDAQTTFMRLSSGKQARYKKKPVPKLPRQASPK